MKNLFAILACFTLAVSAFAATPTITDITQSELQAAIAGKSAVIFDVNGSDSYREGHIPGAIDFLAHRDELASLLPADKNALVVAYCANVHCPMYKLAAEAAIKLGYTNVKHFAPGIEGWRQSGAPTDKS
jgi:rhodanese-related sulfurtransferase